MSTWGSAIACSPSWNDVSALVDRACDGELVDASVRDGRDAHWPLILAGASSGMPARCDRIAGHVGPWTTRPALGAARAPPVGPQAHAEKSAIADLPARRGGRALSP